MKVHLGPVAVGHGTWGGRGRREIREQAQDAKTCLLPGRKAGGDAGGQVGVRGREASTCKTAVPAAH